MIDMHSHIIPMVDDGSKSFEITQKMLQSAKDSGFNGIFATPHYIDKSSVRREEMLEHFNRLKSLAQSFGIELFLGNEVFICPEIADLVKDEVVSCLSDSKYLLVELPRHNEINYLDDVIFELRAHGITPIIAHPERYMIVHENPEVLYEMADKGVLFQVNSGSINGDYGESVRKIAMKLLKHNVYQFMGSDAHSYDRYKAYSKAMEIVKDTCGEEVLKLITKINPAKVKNNEEIETNLLPMKKKFLFWG